MIELKKFVFVFIFTLLSDTNSDISLQNGYSNKLGLKRTLRSPQRRLFGGQEVEYIEQFPYMVWITLNVKENESNVLTGMNSYCGGSIISSRFILTAAHCAIDFTSDTCEDGVSTCSNYSVVEPNTLRVMAGGTSPSSFQVISKVKNAFVPPTLKISDNDNQCLYHSDIALLELKKPLRFNSAVNKLKLPEPVILGKIDLDKTKVNHLVKKHEFCTLLGFGDTSNSDKRPYSERILKFEKIQLIDYRTCINHLKKSNAVITTFKHKGLCTDTALCSYDRKRKDGICFGDSGSPLVCEGEQIGLVSWSPAEIGECVTKRVPDIYTRVDVHVPWIRSVLDNST